MLVSIPGWSCRGWKGFNWGVKQGQGIAAGARRRLKPGCSDSCQRPRGESKSAVSVSKAVSFPLRAYGRCYQEGGAENEL